MNNWRKVWSLSWPERRLLAEAVLLLPLVALSLRLAGLKRCQSAVARLSPVRRGRAQDDGIILARRARVIARLVRAAAAHGPYAANCLQQSLAIWWFLRRRGIEGDLRIGTRKIDGRFEAHAWVEFEGSPLNEGRDVHSRYAAFDGAFRPLN